MKEECAAWWVIHRNFSTAQSGFLYWFPDFLAWEPFVAWVTNL
jgi:hypothetical protein